MAKQPFFTLEDFKMAFSLFCCMCGIGTLGMPGNFARTGPVLGFFATAFMAFANIYASVSMSKVLLLAPTSVKTFSDLGEWSMGKTGRWLAVLSQMGSCLLIPCVFLVLGGGLLDGLFPGAFSPTVWIVLMTVTVLPLCLVPTLKEGAGAAFAGCMGTLVADGLAIAIIVHGMEGHPSIPTPDLDLGQVIGAFGSLSLGYGAGIVLPDVQRQHSEPSRMPRVVGATMIFIMCMLMVIGMVPYFSMGCQGGGNILYTIYPDSTTGLTSVGFAPRWGSVVIAYLAMQMHITIAFAVLLNPAFYIAERLVLGMHQQTPEDVENGLLYQAAGTPVEDLAKQSDVARISISSDRRSKTSLVPPLVAAERQPIHAHEAEVAEYRGANTIKYIVLRVTIVIVLVVLSIIFQDHFSDFADFVGASAITANCILLPTIFYLTKTWSQVPLYERIPAVTVLVVCFVLGCYSTYTAGKNLFTPSDSDATFPYCEPKYQNTIYYNQAA
ncbi:Amino Acid/Auxin Permease (AAAP) Family [Phytophthora cinnamomi]|uniref:Amino Acid/Auxin Permease (AAAP) Family n=1 Tax=Phytophthora cinnamomi TaxID=4785 RepID=UPI00355A51E6|nr:Amino Acid/Auxin Permease (AAAP) Family [Phytophthora cinnamomi]